MHRWMAVFSLGLAALILSCTSPVSDSSSFEGSVHLDLRGFPDIGTGLLADGQQWYTVVVSGYRLDAEGQAEVLTTAAWTKVRADDQIQLDQSFDPKITRIAVGLYSLDRSDALLYFDDWAVQDLVSQTLAISYWIDVDRYLNNHEVVCGISSGLAHQVDSGASVSVPVQNVPYVLYRLNTPAESWTELKLSDSPDRQVGTAVADRPWALSSDLQPAAFPWGTSLWSGASFPSGQAWILVNSFLQFDDGAGTVTLSAVDKTADETRRRGRTLGTISAAVRAGSDDGWYLAAANGGLTLYRWDDGANIPVRIATLPPGAHGFVPWGTGVAYAVGSHVWASAPGEALVDLKDMEEDVLSLVPLTQGHLAVGTWSRVVVVASDNDLGLVQVSSRAGENHSAAYWLPQVGSLLQLGTAEWRYPVSLETWSVGDHFRSRLAELDPTLTRFSPISRLTSGTWVSTDGILWQEDPSSPLGLTRFGWLGFNQAASATPNHWALLADQPQGVRFKAFSSGGAHGLADAEDWSQEKAVGIAGVGSKIRILTQKSDGGPGGELVPRVWIDAGQAVPSDAKARGLGASHLHGAGHPKALLSLP